MSSGLDNTASAAAPPGLTRKGQATYQRIVSAAAALMFKQGVVATTTEEVQAAAGVSASQLYHYFSDKRALVRATIAYQTEAVIAAQQPVLSELDSLESLQAWRDQTVASGASLNCEGGGPIGLLGSEIAATDPEARSAIAAGFARWESAIRDGLATMHGRGELCKTADPKKLALGLLGAMQGGLMLAQIRGEVAPLEAALDVALGHIRSLVCTSEPGCEPAPQGSRGGSPRCR